ncbi:MAG TPA: SDR family NAD(P)-dependent oxidoreductase [Gammaproteobacteria bacterium]|nr:SDR family NAD(P)-dependent oxidoreductase [Gammaproteobacteria bacterium]
MLKAQNKPAIGLELPGLRRGLVAVIPAVAEMATAQSLVTCLQQRGCQAGLYLEPPENAEVVISLLAWQCFTDQDTAIDSNRLNFAIAKKMATRFSEQGGSLVVLQDTGGLFGLGPFEAAQAWAAGGSGLVKTAAYEWPKANLKIIDIARQVQTLEQALDKLLSELFEGGTEIEVGFAPEGRRITPIICEDKAAGDFQSVLSPQSVLLVSGGARGVTSACLIELAKQYQPRLVLLGRTELQKEPELCQQANTEEALIAILVQSAKANAEKINLLQIQKQARQILAAREITATLHALRAAGSEVEYRVCDVQNTQQLQTEVARIRQIWGPITGIIHGAGVLADKLIKDKTEAQFSAVFNTKVLGLQALLAATATEPLRLICLFSSVVGRFGNAGQCDYAMANEILYRVAEAEQQKRGDNCLVKAIGWGPWAAGMVSSELLEHFNRKNIGLIPLDVGAKLFVHEITHSAPGQTELGISGMMAPPQQQIRASKRFNISYATDNYLIDHSIKNLPVIPMCQILAWFMQTAKLLYPQLPIAVCEDLKALKAIRLDHFEEGHSFYVDCEQQSRPEGEYLQMQLHSAEGVLHYTAAIPLSDTVPVFQPIALPAGTEWPWTAEQAYQQGVIFHGPAFQALQQISDLSSEGGRGIVYGIKELSKVNAAWLYPGDWRVDVAAIDGGLQLGWLWNCLRVGPVLPMAMQRFVLYEPGIVQEKVKVTLQIKAQNNVRTIIHVQYCLADGRPIAEVENLTGIVVPV